MRLGGKVAIITGAGRGMGRSDALIFSKEGCKVVVNDINIVDANSVVEEIRSAGGDAIAIKADVTDWNDVNNMTEQAIRHYGKVDILVTNAGWDEIKFFVDQSADEFDRQIDLNLKHHMYCCKAILKHMVERKYGKIISIATDAAHGGSPGEVVYSAAKGGVVSFVKSLAREVGRYNINVNCVCPGLTETPLGEEIAKKMPLAEKIKEAVKKSTPLGRVGQPEDIARAVLFFASDESDFITGQILSVNGGLLMP